MCTLRPGLSGDDPLTTIRLPHVFLVNHLSSTGTDNLARTTKRQNTATKTNNKYKRALINNNTIKHAKIYDRQS